MFNKSKLYKYNAGSLVQSNMLYMFNICEIDKCNKYKVVYI